MNRQELESRVKENSIVNHKSLGECIVKRIKSDSITVYCKSKHREMKFDFPSAFEQGYLIILDDNEPKHIELTDKETEAAVLKTKKFSTNDVKKKDDYNYSANDLIGKAVIKKDGSEAKIVDYKNNGANMQGYIVVESNGKQGKFLYPSSFVNGYLSFEDVTETSAILSDIELFKKNDKETIEKEDEQIKSKINLINELSEHLSCMKKCESVDDFCRLYSSAINQEIYYMKNQGNKRYRLTNGTEVSQSGEKYAYSFETEVELSLLPDFAINIFIDQNDIMYGTVISCEDNTVMFSSNKINSKHLKEIHISFDAWFIMENLNARLEELSEFNNSIVKRLVYGSSKVTIDSELKHRQDNAIEMACTNQITYIWGPPGTGKTYTLAEIVKRLLSENKRVLMLSYSNVSVDGAILEVSKHYEHYHTGEIIRYGYPKDKRLLNSDNLLSSYSVALSSNPKLLQRQKELIKEKEQTENKTKKYKEIQEELNKIRAKIKSDEDRVVKNANFVATTLSKAICNKQIYNQLFDAVIIDEVSMAYTPQIIYAANLAKSHFCCIGDFNQLPPIVQNENDKNVLKFDVFEYCGDVNNMVILDEQRRMHKDIAKFISANMYFGSLKSHDSTIEREKITKLEPFSEKSITYVDIHDLKSRTKVVGTSHSNLISALVSARITVKVLENNELEIGVITPYNEQAKLINSILQVSLSVEDRKRVVCATVHQFQGSQRDVIIYDATDAKGEIQHPGTLLVSSKHNISNRLFNVAMTRAKGKFIVVADREFIDAGLTKGKTEKTKKTKSLFYSLSKLSEFSKLIVNANDLDFLAEYKPSKKFASFKSNKRSFDIYKSDLRCAKHTVRFDIASRITSYEFNNKYLNVIDTLERNEITTTIYIDSFLNKNENYSTYAEKRVFTLTDLTIIDNEIVWIGNPLTKGSLVWRIKSKTVATKIANM